MGGVAASEFHATITLLLPLILALLFSLMARAAILTGLEKVMTTKEARRWGAGETKAPSSIQDPLTTMEKCPSQV